MQIQLVPKVVLFSYWQNRVMAILNSKHTMCSVLISYSNQIGYSTQWLVPLCIWQCLLYKTGKRNVTERVGDWRNPFCSYCRFAYLTRFHYENCISLLVWEFPLERWFAETFLQLPRSSIWIFFLWQGFFHQNRIMTKNAEELNISTSVHLCNLLAICKWQFYALSGKKCIRVVKIFINAPKMVNRSQRKALNSWWKASCL